MRVWIILINLNELLHPPEILVGESFGQRFISPDVGGKFLDHAAAPLGIFDFMADLCSDTPIQIDQFGIDCPDRSVAGMSDQVDDLRKTLIHNKNDTLRYRISFGVRGAGKTLSACAL